MRKITLLALFLVLLLSMSACVTPVADSDGDGDAEVPEEGSFKIALMTETVSQNEENFRVAEMLMEKYGDMIVYVTFPDNFVAEQETLIANMLSAVSDPAVGAFVVCGTPQGAAAGFEKMREQRPDLLIISGMPTEDPNLVGPRADLLMLGDEIKMGYTIPAQAKKMGAEVLVHYSFPRHMSIPLLAQRRDIIKAESEKLGLEFVDATAPDPLGDSGLPGAQLYMLEDVPRKIREYGPNTAFFNTNCGMQEPLIRAILEHGGMMPQQCCPSPTHAFPSALGIEVPADKNGDIPYITEQIRLKIVELGGAGRFSTWPVPMSMMFTEAGVEYAKAYLEGKTDGKNDLKVLEEICTDIAGREITLTTYNGKDKDGKDFTFDHFYLMTSDYMVFE